jgi:hypothetical protein
MIPARAQPNKRKLTPLLVQRLRPQARAYLVWDTVQRCLAFRVEPTGTWLTRSSTATTKSNQEAQRNWASGTDEQRKLR